MRKLFNVIHNLITCHICHGMKTIELPNGDTKQCPACKGKGYL